MEPPGATQEDGWTPMVFPSASALRTYDAQLVPHKRTRTYTRAQGYSEKPPFRGSARVDTQLFATFFLFRLV